MKTSRILFFLVLIAPYTYAQGDDFGFEQSAEKPAVVVSGEASSKIIAYYDEFDSASKLKLGDLFYGKLNFSAKTSFADAVINFKIKPEYIDGTWNNPFKIDEAYTSFYFGSVNLESGIRKLTWGRADSFGPLDVINPIDYSDLSEMTNLSAIKIARPLLHLTLNPNGFTKIEFVFVPWLEGNKYDLDGRWTPAEISKLSMFNFQENPQIESVKYMQGGLRFTQTIGSFDFGIQYYYGRLNRPTYSLQSPNTIEIDYNPYHQAGLDYAQVIAGFNLRAELAANITQDLDGDDPAVYNPSINWSLGFDRNLFWQINLNLQANEIIRLQHDKIGTKSNGYLPDVENDKGITYTRITAILSKKILHDELEFKATCLADIEDTDFYVMPSIVWTKGDANISVELVGGLFFGKEDSELGQYKNNGYVKTVLTYSF